MMKKDFLSSVNKMDGSHRITIVQPLEECDNLINDYLLQSEYEEFLYYLLK